MALTPRELTADEQQAIKQLAHSRTASARLVERAKIILLAGKGDKVPAIAEQLKLTESIVRTRLKRFNADGLAGLTDRDRSGRPATYTPAEVAEVSTASLTKPEKLELPFGCSTMDRLAAYLQEGKGIAISRRRISELLIAEGFRWPTQETWEGFRVDPEFAEKMGQVRTMQADLRQTDLCAYLSAILLAGLALNALFGLWWA